MADSNDGAGSGNDNNNVDVKEDTTPPQSISVLFICLGNICKHTALPSTPPSTPPPESSSTEASSPPPGRSPMAEAVFRHLTTSSSPSHLSIISKIDSAGTAAYHVGAEPDPRTMSTLIENGIDDYTHHARKVSPADFAEFDYILAMDRENLQDLQYRSSRRGKQPHGAKTAKVMLFGDFGGTPGEEVVDPYYGARDGFDVAYEQMVRFTKGFVKQVLG